MTLPKGVTRDSSCHPLISFRIIPLPPSASAYSLPLVEDKSHFFVTLASPKFLDKPDETSFESWHSEKLK